MEVTDTKSDTNANADDTSLESKIEYAKSLGRKTALLLDMYKLMNPNQTMVRPRRMMSTCMINSNSSSPEMSLALRERMLEGMTIDVTKNHKEND
jgi:hypothetical protein